MDASGSVTLHFSPLETARFGLRIYRASVEAVDADALAAEIERERVDVAILRLPARALGEVNKLTQRGLAPIVADTLVSYETVLGSRNAPQNAESTVTLRTATRSDAELLARMARAIFVGYVSHYHANPLFAHDKILDGYAEWAARHVGVDDGSAAWIVERDREPVGFSCYCLAHDSRTAVGVLNGVLPEARRKGSYEAMLRQMLSRFDSLGMKRFVIATQVQNFAVQRTWAASGLVLCSASNTVHINAVRR